MLDTNLVESNSQNNYNFLFILEIILNTNNL